MKTKKDQINKLIATGVTDPAVIAKKANASLYYVRWLMRPASHYATLLVSKSKRMAKALAQLRLRYGTQKEGVEQAIFDHLKKAA